MVRIGIIVVQTADSLAVTVKGASIAGNGSPYLEFLIIEAAVIIQNIFVHGNICNELTVDGIAAAADLFCKPVQLTCIGDLIGSFISTFPFGCFEGITNGFTVCQKIGTEACIAINMGNRFCLYILIGVNRLSTAAADIAVVDLSAANYGVSILIFAVDGLTKCFAQQVCYLADCELSRSLAAVFGLGFGQIVAVGNGSIRTARFTHYTTLNFAASYETDVVAIGNGGVVLANHAAGVCASGDATAVGAVGNNTVLCAFTDNTACTFRCIDSPAIGAFTNSSFAGFSLLRTCNTANPIRAGDCTGVFALGDFAIFSVTYNTTDYIAFCSVANHTAVGAVLNGDFYSSADDAAKIHSTFEGVNETAVMAINDQAINNMTCNTAGKHCAIDGCTAVAIGNLRTVCLIDGRPYRTCNAANIV